jgi:magnesium transporter
MSTEPFSSEELRTAWPVLSTEERLEAVDAMPTREANAFFRLLPSADQGALLAGSPPEQAQLWLRTLPPDDAADVLQHSPASARDAMLCVLDPRTRDEVSALLAYAEDRAGGLMSPRFARVRADSTVEEALVYLRQQVRQNLETIYYAYALGVDQRLLGVVSLRELFAASGSKLVRDVMRTNFVVVHENEDQEAVAHVLAMHDLLAVPVIDAEGRMRGIVTFDDVADAMQKETTEDIQKLGAVEVLGAPYLQVGMLQMVKKRIGWLAILFVSEMLTTSAMSHYEDQIASNVMLALFVPLIISSGGNSGSQATTLVIRAMALGELRLRDAARVLRRELVTGLLLGLMLGIVGMLRVGTWRLLFDSYGDYWLRLALAVGLSVIGVVTWGSLVGALLPFALRRIKLDPATASAPFVATLVDVSGLVIYFNVAYYVLRWQ